MITVTLHTGGGMFDEEVEVNFPEGPREGQTVRIALSAVDRAHAAMVYQGRETDRDMIFRVDRTEWRVGGAGKIGQYHAYLQFVRGE